MHVFIRLHQFASVILIESHFYQVEAQSHFTRHHTLAFSRTIQPIIRFRWQFDANIKRNYCSLKTRVISIKRSLYGLDFFGQIIWIRIYSQFKV